jgi:hypothetical protein
MPPAVSQKSLFLVKKGVEKRNRSTQTARCGEGSDSYFLRRGLRKRRIPIAGFERVTSDSKGQRIRIIAFGDKKIGLTPYFKN